MAQNVILKLDKVCKSFPGVKALDDVSLMVYKGEVLALAGENGAGKSTLMKIMTGIYQMDSGSMMFDGREVIVRSPKEAEVLGLSIIHQELNILPGKSVAENIYLGRLPMKRIHIVDWKRMFENTESLFENLNIPIDVTQSVRGMSVAQQQMIEIAKAVNYNAKLVVMDEPTSSLTSEETRLLFSIIRKLKSQGVSIIFITHRLDEIFEIADRVAVMRDGCSVGIKSIEDITKKELIAFMIGRAMERQFPLRESCIGDEMLRVEHLADGGKKVHDVSFTLHRGEVLGFAGLVGSGRTETMRMLFGADKKVGGKIFLNGKEVRIRNPRDSVRLRIAFVTEDRKNEGLLLGKRLRMNIVMVALDKIIRKGFINEKIEIEKASDYIKELKIITPSVNQLAMYLSGGNQQKVVVAKWLFSDAELIILDEPTRGIDVGAKYEIYELINRLAGLGKGIIMVSSDMEEIIGISDRIIAMHEGRVAGIVSKENFSSSLISEYTIGGRAL